MVRYRGNDRAHARDPASCGSGRARPASLPDADAAARTPSRFPITPTTASSTASPRPPRCRPTSRRGFDSSRTPPRFHEDFVVHRALAATPSTARREDGVDFDPRKLGGSTFGIFLRFPRAFRRARRAASRTRRRASGTTIAGLRPRTLGARGAWVAAAARAPGTRPRLAETFDRNSSRSTRRITLLDAVRGSESTTRTSWTRKSGFKRAEMAFCAASRRSLGAVSGRGTTYSTSRLGPPPAGRPRSRPRR